MSRAQNITTCLRFDNQAEEAVKFYTGIFKNSRILQIALHGSAGFERHGKPAGTVMTIAFELNGQTFIAINDGSAASFNEAISLQVYCNNQEELDYFWERLSAGGDIKEQQGGWLKDKYGVSWQIVPANLIDMITDRDSDKTDRVMEALMHMKKLDINELKRAYLGKSLH